MKKEYETLSLDVVKFEAQDVITSSLNASTPGSSNDDKENEVIPEPPADL